MNKRFIVLLCVVFALQSVIACKSTPKQAGDVEETQIADSTGNQTFTGKETNTDSAGGGSAGGSGSGSASNGEVSPIVSDDDFASGSFSGVQEITERPNNSPKILNQGNSSTSSSGSSGSSGSSSSSSGSKTTTRPSTNSSTPSTSASSGTGSTGTTGSTSSSGSTPSSSSTTQPSTSSTTTPSSSGSTGTTTTPSSSSSSSTTGSTSSSGTSPNGTSPSTSSSTTTKPSTSTGSTSGTSGSSTPSTTGTTSSSTTPSTPSTTSTTTKPSTNNAGSTSSSGTSSSTAPSTTGTTSGSSGSSGSGDGGTGVTANRIVSPIRATTANTTGRQNQDPYESYSNAVNSFSDYPESAVEADNNYEISRTVQVRVGQRLEVEYPGEKWVYVGEKTSQSGLKYAQRRFINGNTDFTFYAEKEGNYILHFSYYDVYSDSIFSDALAVEVKEKNSSAPASVSAPEYVLPVPDTSMTTTSEAVQLASASQAPSSAASPTVGQTVTQNTQASQAQTQARTQTPSPQPTASSADLLKKAREQIASGDGTGALKTLDEFFSFSKTRLDEGWFLRGQAYELNGQSKNIKAAMSAYTIVTEGYPSSEHWNAADSRMRYIKRYFVSID